MRIATWNINHRAQVKQIPVTMAAAIASLNADSIVLTEYVEGKADRKFYPHRARFLKEMSACGYVHMQLSECVSNHNQVAIFSRQPLQSGSITGPQFHAAMPSNVLHTTIPGDNVELLGLRVPAFKSNANKRVCWDWILSTAGSVRDRAFIIIGDFNTDLGYSRARCGDSMLHLLENGWTHAVPATGASYFDKKERAFRLDHAFVTDKVEVSSAQYVVANGDYVFAGNEAGALSDHAPLVIDIAVPTPN